MDREVVVTLRLDNAQGVRNLGKLQAELLGVRDRIKLLNSIIRENGTATKGQERQLGELTAKARNLSVQIRELGNNLSGATAAGLRFRDKMADAARAGLGAFGLNILGVTAAVTAAVRVFQDAGATIAEFDQGLANLRALGPDIAARIDDIAAATKTAGIAFGFTAKQSLDAVEALAKAGVSVDNILGGALEGTLTLAAAGEIEVADAAETASKAMTQFGLAGKDVTHIADLLTAGALKAVGGVKDLNDALKLSGLTAAQFGLSIDETVGALTAFAANGLLGEEAGAALQQALLKLANPSKEASKTLKKLGIEVFDAQGNFVGLARLAGELREKMAELTQEQRTEALATLFGSRAIRAANVLYKEGEDGIKKYTDAVNDSGIAQRVAEEKQNSLSGSLKKLGAAYDALVLKLENSKGVLKDIADLLTKVFIGLAGGSSDDAAVKRIDDFAERVTKKLRDLGDKITTIQSGGAVSDELKKKLDSESALVTATVNHNIDNAERLAAAREKLSAQALAAEEGGAKREIAFARARLELFDELVSKRKEEAAAATKAGAIAAGAADAEGAATGRTIAVINAEIQELKKKQELATNSKGFKDIQKEIDDLEAEKRAIDGTVEKLVKKKDALADVRKELERIQERQAPDTEQSRIDAVNKLYDELAKKAKGNADLLNQIEAGRVTDLNAILIAGNQAQIDSEARVTAALNAELLARTDALNQYAQDQQAINQLLDDANNLYINNAIGGLEEFAGAMESNFERGSAAAKALATLGKVLAIADVLIRLQQETATIAATYAAAPPVAAALEAAAVTRAGLRVATIIASAATAGFKEGGYTPRHPSDSKAVGVVHANEFVANARAVRDPVVGPIINWIDRWQRRYGVGKPPFAGGGFTQTHGTALVNFPTGSVPTPPMDQLIQVQQAADMRAINFAPVVSVVEINKVQNRVKIIEGLASNA